MQGKIDSGYVHIVGVGTVSQSYYCQNANVTNWLNLVVEPITVPDSVYCCSAPYNDVTAIQCSGYDNITEMPADVNIEIHPNPATTLVNISNPENLPISAIAVYNESGQLCRDYNKNENTISVANLPLGRYFVRIKTGNILLFKPFVKN
jgi:hypothetical protein